MSAKPSDKDTQTITAKRLRRIDTTAYDHELDEIVDAKSIFFPTSTNYRILN